MKLVLEIEYLSGICFAAPGPEAEVADWPPQPDRVFSALVAAWAARGEDQAEAKALQWLENQPPPSIDASDADQRSAPVAFVPPNDPRSGRKSAATQVLPALRRRQPRRFPAARPSNAEVHLLWDDVEMDGATLSALQRVAHDVAYVGHSASLTRCRFVVDGEAAPPRYGRRRARRRVYPGRMAELRREFAAGRRPHAGDPTKMVAEPGAERTNVFGDRWLLLEHIGGDMPDLRACALVAKTIRDAILSGYQREGLGAGIPEVVSGHTSGGRPSQQPHLAVIPLPFAGFPFADGHVMGFAVVPPERSAILDDPDFRRALRSVAPMDEGHGRRVLTVQTRRSAQADQTFRVELSPSFEPPAERRSLDPALYTRVAREFATLTPIALDRHLKARGAGARQEELREQIVRACSNVGLPEPEAVIADRHSTFEGVPSAYPSGKSPPWMAWRLPSSLVTRQLTHAFLRFPVEVAGPLILGAGRYVGLGLCRAVTPEGRRADAER